MNWARRILDAYPRTIVFVCSLLASSAFFVATPRSGKMVVNGDYEDQVSNLLAGDRLIDDHGQVMTRTPPLYSMTLAAIRTVSAQIGVSELAVLFAFAAFCLAATAVCVHDLAALVIGRERAWIAGLLFAVHPHVLLGVVWPLSETPFLLFMYASLGVYLHALTGNSRHRGSLMAVAGVLAGISLLVRPAGLFVPLIMGALVLVLGKMTALTRLRCAALLAAGVVLTLLPWEGYVWRHSGRFVLISSNGVSTLRDGFAFYKARRSPIWIPARADRIAQAVWKNYENLHEVSSVARLVLAGGRNDPLGLVQLYSYKAVRSWYGVDSQQPAKELVNVVMAALVLIPAAFGMRRFFRRAPIGELHAGIVLVILILYFWAITTVTVSIARYMVPTTALMCVFIPLCLPDRWFAERQDADAGRQPRLELAS